MQRPLLMMSSSWQARRLAPRVRHCLGAPLTVCRPQWLGVFAASLLGASLLPSQT